MAHRLESPRSSVATEPGASLSMPTTSPTAPRPPMMRRVVNNIPTAASREPSVLCGRALELGMGSLADQAGGLNRYYFGLVSALAKAGWDVQGLVVSDTPGPVAEADRLIIQRAAARNAPLLRRWRGVRSHFKQLMEDSPPDVCSSHFALYAYPVAKRLAGLPHVVQFQGPWADEMRREGDGLFANRIRRHIERRVFRTADLFIVLSQAFSKVLQERYAVDASRIRVVPGAIEAERFNPRQTRPEARGVLDWPTDRPILLCVRRLVPRMGLLALLEAMEAVRAAHPQVLLMIAGRGMLEDALKREIQERGLQQHVRLLGFVPDEHLPLAYRAADLSVVPTESLEGFGLITLESLAAGTPVLVTPVGGLPEAVAGLSPDLILPDHSPDSIAAAIIAALSGSLDLPDADRCRRYVRDHFSWDVIAPRVADVYREAIDLHHRG